MSMDLSTPEITVGSIRCGISLTASAVPCSRRAPCLTASAIKARFWSADIVLITKGPMSGLLWICVSIAAANASRNCDATESRTKMRSVDMQICPDYASKVSELETFSEAQMLKLTFIKAPSAHCVAAFSIFASAITIALFLPPSSISTGLRCLPAEAAITRPTRVPPVKLIFFTLGCATSCSVIFAPSEALWVIKLRQPAGRPASRKTSAIAQAHCGAASEPLKIAVLPAASGKVMDRRPRW